MNKRGFEFSFAWIFAIIAGAAIIFLAVYASTSLIGNSRYETDTKIAAQLESVLNPVGTNLEEAKLLTIGFPDETRVFNRCSEAGNFGTQSLSTSVRSGIGREWLPPGAEISSKDKYVFSESSVQSNEVYAFVKPLEMPYKIADLIFIYAGSYCFVGPPRDIEEEITDLSMPGINISSNVKECPEGSKSVCFSSSDRDCDKKVSLNAADEETLIYAAIFSDDKIYECQLRRLMKRNAELAAIYGEKSEFLAGQGCSTNLAGELGSYASMLNNFKDSGDIVPIKLKADELEEKNDKLICKLF